MTLVAKIRIYSIVLQIKNSGLCSLFLFVVVLLGLSACEPQSLTTQEKVVYSGPIMGTQYRITMLLDSIDDKTLSEQRYKTIEEKVVGVMESVNNSMSTYIEDSELSQLNKAPSNNAINLSDGLFEVIQESLLISQMSDGAFDITLGNVVNSWGFGERGRIDTVPDDDVLNELKSRVGYQNLLMKDRSVTKLVDGIEINLSAIAKGYGVDQVANVLIGLGIDDFLIDIGGELRASKPEGSTHGWRIGVEKPHVLGGVQEVIGLHNQAIATSGDYRNYLVVDGKQYSHTIDPATLRPVLHKLALVSVISDNTSTADALATAIMAMGEVQGLEFVNKHNLAAYMVVRSDEPDSYKIQMTEAFKHYLL